MDQIKYMYLIYYLNVILLSIHKSYHLNRITKYTRKKADLEIQSNPSYHKLSTATLAYAPLRSRHLFCAVVSLPQRKKEDCYPCLNPGTNRCLCLTCWFGNT